MKKFLYIFVPLLLAITLTLAFHYLAPSVAETIAFNRFPEEDQDRIRQEYRDWRDKPIHLPLAALEAAPFTTQTVAAVRSFDKAWKKDRARAEKFSRPYQNGKISFDYANVKPEVEALAPLIDAFIAVIERPDYDASLLASMNRRDFSMLPRADGMAFMTCKELLRLQAQAAAHERHWPEAFQSVEQMARASHTNRYAYIIVQKMSLVVRTQAVELWTDLVNQCDDAKLLRRTLNIQNALAGQMQYYGDPEVPLMAYAAISNLREIKRAGLVLDYQDKTGRELDALRFESSARLWESVYADEVKTSPTQAAYRQENILTYRQMAREMSAKRPSLKLPFIFGRFRPDFSDLLADPLACARKLNVLRLQTARKLYRLENGMEPASDADLVPRYLPSPVGAAGAK